MRIKDRPEYLGDRGLSVQAGSAVVDTPPFRLGSKPSVSCLGPWLTFLCLCLFGYALFGKGWAYIGVPPLFIGEVLLFCGAVSFLWFGGWRGFYPIACASGGWLVLLVAGGLLRILPDLPVYGMDTLRDAAIWGYCAFAIIVSGSIIARPSNLVALLQKYRQFALIFPVCVPLVWLLTHFFEQSLPRWPWADMPLVLVKGGDVMVHLAGILAFGVAGFGGLERGGWKTAARVTLLASCVVLVGTFDRSGLFAFLAVFAVCFLHRPGDRLLWRLIVLGVGGLLLLAATGIRIQMPGREREISFHQLIANLGSVGGASRTGDLDDTREWRLQFWSDIVNYTVLGKYFWTGKGFGINIAADDGYVSGNPDPVLRSPHNAHLTMLARGGVPGFALWALVQLTWAGSLLGAYFRSRRRRERQWTELFLFLLTYWLAFMINASFDVFLEGPMGGIWFWTLYGVGLAALWLYRFHPAAVDWGEIVDSAKLQVPLAPGMSFGGGSP